MKLALEREQSASSAFSLVPLRIGSGVTFKLRASVELSEHERKLLGQYRLNTVPLVAGNTADDLRKGFRQALVLAFLVFLVCWFLVSQSFAATIALLVLAAMTVVYYWHEREQIIVSDLLADGRVFSCDSVVTLIEKEAQLENMASYLRQVLESAKYWDDREVIDIAPLDRALLKQSILTHRA